MMFRSIFWSQAGQAGSQNSSGGPVNSLTGNSGGAVPPTGGNINTVGTGSITVVGNPGTSTLTAQLTGLTNHDVLVGAGTATITKVSPSTAGFVLTSNGVAADPSFQAAAATGIVTINGDIGSVTGTTVSLKTNGGEGTPFFTGSGTAMSLVFTSSGTHNTGIGNACLQSVTGSVTQTAALGNSSLTSLTSGNGNVAIGTSAGQNLVSGQQNTLLGISTGLNYTGAESSNILIGSQTRGTLGESNVLRIGSGTGSSSGNIAQGSAFIQGIYGATPSSPQMVTISSAGNLGSQVLPVTMFWVDQTSASVTMATNTGYTSDDGASLVTFTLPTASAIGDVVEINGKGSGGWTIAQAAGQQIQISPTATTSGAGGSLSSTHQYDNVRLRCLTANTIWTVVSQQSTGLTVV